MSRDKLIKLLTIIFIFVTPKRIAIFSLSFFRKSDSKFAMLIRFLCLKKVCKECGERVAVFSDVYLLNIENLSLGSNISIHPFCYIDAAGGIEIHDNVSIAHRTTILSSSHIYNSIDKVIRESGYLFKRTVIEEDVWIGADVKILMGVTVKKGSVVAAGAVVNKDNLEYTIIGGVPAKVIKNRFDA